jgi:hypothetical protein
MSKEERVAEVLRISQSPAPEITLRNYTYDWTWRSSNQADQSAQGVQVDRGKEFIIKLQVCAWDLRGDLRLPYPWHIA